MNYRIEEYTEDGPVRNAKHSVAGGRSPFGKWFNDLDPGTAARVDRYIRRMEAGNFGAAKALRGGVYELRWTSDRAIEFITGWTGKHWSFCWVAEISDGRMQT